MDARIARVLEPLPNTFQTANWNVNELRDRRIPVRKFIKEVGILRSKLIIEGVLVKLLRKGLQDHHWQSPQTCTPRQMYAFCTWLNDENGTKFIYRARRACMLERNRLQNETAIELAYIGALKHQLNEYEKLKMSVQMGMRELVQVRNSMLPASNYEGINRSRLEELCWESYSQYQINNELPVLAYTDERMRTVQRFFEELVTKNHRIDFMLEGARREQMNNYIQRKLHAYALEGNFELVETFASYQEAVGREVGDNILQAINTMRRPRHGA